MENCVQEIEIMLLINYNNPLLVEIQQVWQQQKLFTALRVECLHIILAASLNFPLNMTLNSILGAQTGSFPLELW